MKDEHLGDGVYISFDGYQWWLAVNNHQNKVVALEPAVVRNLSDYVRRTYDHYANLNTLSKQQAKKEAQKGTTDLSSSEPTQTDTGETSSTNASSSTD